MREETVQLIHRPEGTPLAESRLCVGRIGRLLEITKQEACLY